MFRKVLIANRGEIAVRVIRACREMGVRTVAVYSEADRASLAVRLADEALCIGPAPPVESYLRIPALLDAAARAGADAVHPGYGFLSESAAFAEACRGAGLVFVGPSPRVIALMGDKLQARRTVEQWGVPVIPGTHGEALDEEKVVGAAEALGFPVMLKAVAGGGGKGMRIVRGPGELASAFRNASSEAYQSFGRRDLYLETCLEGARHVEFQVAGDSEGGAIHLFERECSIQRRHQKLIEESPSPCLTPELREAMGRAAVAITRGIGYVGVGTVEFLLAADRRRFFFLEMNTRLQVEHPVTEMATGIDLVNLQLRTTAGETLGIAQEGVQRRGHAVEARICAEDPVRDFLPSAGRITELHVPGGPSIRMDTDLYVGQEVTLFYDPLLAKLVAHGRDRRTALDRLRHALVELHVGGIETTAGILARVLDHPRFRRGDYDTGFLEGFLEELRGGDGDGDGDPRVPLACLAAALVSHRRGGSVVRVGAGVPDRVREDPWILFGRVEQMRRVPGIE